MNFVLAIATASAVDFCKSSDDLRTIEGRNSGRSRTKQTCDQHNGVPVLLNVYMWSCRMKDDMLLCLKWAVEIIKKVNLVYICGYR